MRLAVWLAAGLFVVPCMALGQSGNGPEPPPTAEEFAKGSELFAGICSHCHGPHMVNPGTVSFDLRKFPHDDRARFFNSVRNGKNTMPPWKDVLHPDEIEAVWAYVRTGGVEPK